MGQTDPALKRSRNEPLPSLMFSGAKSTPSNAGRHFAASAAIRCMTMRASLTFARLVARYRNLNASPCEPMCSRVRSTKSCTEGVGRWRASVAVACGDDGPQQRLQVKGTGGHDHVREGKR